MKNNIKRKVFTCKAVEASLTSLARLVKSEKELEELIERLNIIIRPMGNKQYVCEAVYSYACDNGKTIEEFATGKWNFMIMAEQLVKKQPHILHKIETEGLNVDDIDAALGEIRERLGCKVCKLYSNGLENYIVEGDDFISYPNTFQRIGWAVLSHELYD
ncbi:hypothetical protein [Bacteroides caecimuris]|jgi:hypothetical protein|uniref:hypothetical protein n=1 Tax=Bacteroides caecimuris TaxID=1796613 RepID=UPI0015ADB8DE|nr:hypothetical protein [Bacteroides caecimuris]